MPRPTWLRTTSGTGRAAPADPAAAVHVDDHREGPDADGRPGRRTRGGKVDVEALLGQRPVGDTVDRRRNRCGRRSGRACRGGGLGAGGSEAENPTIPTTTAIAIATAMASVPARPVAPLRCRMSSSSRGAPMAGARPTRDSARGGLRAVDTAAATDSGPRWLGCRRSADAGGHAHGVIRGAVPTVKISEPGRTPLQLVVRRTIDVGRDCDGVLLADA